MNVAGGLFELGAINFNRTSTTAFQIGNSSTTVNGILQLNGRDDSAVFGSAGLTYIRVAGSGNLTIANVNAGTGTQTMGLRLSGTDASGRFIVETGRTLTISSIISGVSATTGFTKTGTGTLVLSGANTFAGGVNHNAGAIHYTNNSSFGTGTLTIGTGVVSASGFASSPGTSFLNNTTAANTTIANAIVMPAPTSDTTYTLQKTGSGGQLNLTGTISGGSASMKLFLQTSVSGDSTTTFRFAGNNTFQAGQIEIWRGSIVIANMNGLGSSANLLRLNTNTNNTLGNLRFEVGGTFANPIEFLWPNSINPGSNTVVLSGDLSGVEPWEVIGTGGGGTGTLVLEGASNTNSGNITVQTGATLQVGNGGTAGSLGDANVINNGTLRFNRSDALSVANVISGSGSVIQHGAGTTTLASANTFSGPLNVNAGTLALSATGSLTTNTINVAGGVFDVSAVPGGYTVNLGQTINAGRTGTPSTDVLGNLTVQGTLGVGPVSAVRTATFANNLTLSGAALNFDLANVTTAGSGVNDLVIVNGDLTLTGLNTVNVNQISGSLTSGTYTLFNYAGTLTGTAANLALAGGGGSTRQSFTFDVGTGSNSAITLQVVGSPANLTWVGNGSNNVWDLVTTVNWTGHPTDNRFYNLDNVTFTDSGVGGATPVTLIGTLVPASVTVNSTQNYTFDGSGFITGTGGLTKQGTGTLVLVTDNTYTGGTTISAGTLQLGNGGTTGSITGSVVNNAALEYNRSNADTFAGIISGTGVLVVRGGGTLTLSAANTYTGATTITGASTLSVGSDSNLGTAPGSATAGQLVLNDGTLSTSAGFTLNANRGIALGPTSGTGGGTINVASGTLTYNGVIANNGGGTGSLTKTGTGTLSLGGTNTYSGGTTVSGGAVHFTSSGAFGTGTITFDTGVVSVSGFATSPGTPFLNNTTVADTTLANDIVLPTPSFNTTYTFVKTGSGGQINFTGNISGGNAVTKLFLNSSVPGDNTTIYRFAGNNTFRATIEVWRGAIVVASNSALGDPSTVIRFNSNNNLALGDLRFDASVTLANPIEFVLGGGGPVNTNAFNVTLTGNLSGGYAGGLTKLGSGTLTITGTNTYTGGTNVNAGTLLVNGDNFSATGNVTVANAATLGGSGSLSGVVTVQTGGTIRGGDPSSTLDNALTLADGLTTQNGATIAVRLLTLTPNVSSTNPPSNSFLNILGGSTTVNSGTNFLIDGSSLAFNPSITYSYRIAAGAGDQSILSIISQSQFSTVNFANAGDFVFSVTGNAGGEIFLIVEPIPEPSLLLALAGGVLCLARRVRSKHKTASAS